MKDLIVTFICFVFLVPCFAAGHEKQQKLIRDVRGEYAITSDSRVSMAEAKENARKDAQKNALIKAFGQQISIIEKIETSSAGESFSSLNILQNNGEIVECTFKDEGYGPHPNRPSEMVFYCKADIKVQKGTEPDPSFTATISGIHKSYLSEEFCEFEITPTQTAYLQVFLFEDSEVGYYLYPGGSSHGVLLQADTPIRLPQKGNMGIQFFTNQQRETNTLVFLLTKKEYPFNIANPTRQDIDRFIALIPNDNKFVSYHIVDIIKR